jgi:hypothetical protein
MECTVVRVVASHYFEASLVLLDAYQKLREQSRHWVTFSLGFIRIFQLLCKVSVNSEGRFRLVFELWGTALVVEILLFVGNEPG